MLQSATAEPCGTFRSWPGNVSSQLVHLGSLQIITRRVSYSFEIDRRCPFHAYFLEKWLIAVSHIFPSRMGVGAVQLCLKILVNQSTISTRSGHQAIAFNFIPSGRTACNSPPPEHHSSNKNARHFYSSPTRQESHFLEHFRFFWFSFFLAFSEQIQQLVTRPDFNQACKIHDLCYKRAIDKCSSWWCKLLKICTGKMYVTNYNWEKDKDTGKVRSKFTILTVL